MWVYQAILQWAFVIVVSSSPLEARSSTLGTTVLQEDVFKAVVVSSILPLNVYVTGPCAGVSAILQPCSPFNSLCVSDGLVISVNSSTTFIGAISNSATCSGSFVLSLKGGRGIRSVKFQAGNFSHVLMETITEGVTPFHLLH